METLHVFQALLEFGFAGASRIPSVAVSENCRNWLGWWLWRLPRAKELWLVWHRWLLNSEMFWDVILYDILVWEIWRYSGMPSCMTPYGHIQHLEGFFLNSSLLWTCNGGCIPRDFRRLSSAGRPVKPPSTPPLGARGPNIQGEHFPGWWSAPPVVRDFMTFQVSTLLLQCAS